MIEQAKLSNNALAVMALASEYCRALELVQSCEQRDFVAKMVRLLPRIYMSVTDLPRSEPDEPEYMFGAAHLREDDYNRVRDDIAALLGNEDTYLETIHEDMKYSDTPIGASISEGLADIFQVLYNFIEDVRNADVETTLSHLASLRSDFTDFWSQTLCNIMRPLNELAQRIETDDETGNDFPTDSDELDFV